MTCAMHLHDPCNGPVEDKKAYGHVVDLCLRHWFRLRAREVPFKWQSAKQLEQWAADTEKRQNDRQETTP